MVMGLLSSMLGLIVILLCADTTSNQKTRQDQLRMVITIRSLMKTSSRFDLCSRTSAVALVLRSYSDKYSAHHTMPGSLR